MVSDASHGLVQSSFLGGQSPASEAAGPSQANPSPSSKPRQTASPAGPQNQKPFNPGEGDRVGYLVGIDGQPLSNQDIWKMLVPNERTRRVGLGDSLKEDYEELGQDDVDGEDEDDENEHDNPRNRGRLGQRQMADLVNYEFEGRPSNTRNAYYPRINHFVLWCLQVEFCRPVPYAERFLKFLMWRKDNVIGQAAELTKNTLRQYKSAFSKAKYTFETTFGYDLGAPLTKYGPFKLFARGFATEQHEKFKKARLDPQRGTVAEMMTREDFIKVAKECDKMGMNPAAVKYGSMMKTAYQAIFRGDDERGVAFADMFVTELPLTAVGPDRAKAYCASSRGGKKNSQNKPEYACMVRAKDAAVCAVGANVRHFYVRFTHQGERHPDFLDSKWRALLFWPAENDPTGTKQIHTTTQTQAFKTILTRAGIQSSKIVHIFRPSAAFEAASHGCSFESIMRAGRWHYSNCEALAMSYSGSLCADVCLVLAGFSSDTQDYILPRAAAPIPPDLMKLAQAQLWPWVEEELQKVQEYNEKISDPRARLFCEINVLEMLQDWRVVLLQDAVDLQHVQSFNVDKGDPLFKSEEFRRYMYLAKDAAANRVRSHQLNKPVSRLDVVEQQKKLDQTLQFMADHEETILSSLQNLFEKFHTTGRLATVEAFGSEGAAFADQSVVSPLRATSRLRATPPRQVEPRVLFPDPTPSFGASGTTAAHGPIQQTPAAPSSEVVKQALQQIENVALAAKQAATALSNVLEHPCDSCEGFAHARAAVHAASQASMQAEAILQAAQGSSSERPPRPVHASRVPLHPTQRNSGMQEPSHGESASTRNHVPPTLTQPLRPERITAPGRKDRDETELYMLPPGATLEEIWKYFFHEGPNKKLPIRALMKKYGVDNWFLRNDAADNNRKHVYNTRYKVIICEILYCMHEYKEGEHQACARVAKVAEDLKKTPNQFAAYLSRQGAIAHHKDLVFGSQPRKLGGLLLPWVDGYNLPR